MTHRFADIVQTPSVRQYQDQMGVGDRNHRLRSLGGPNHRLGPTEIEFIGERDSFYMASVSETGWPYVQHRGGPAGFLQVLDDTTLAFADFRGNLQYLSVGNVLHDDRVSLILVDYPGKSRMKLLGRARIVDASAEAELVARLQHPTYRAKIERAIIITTEAYDWNCPQHITPRFTEAEFAAHQRPVLARIEQLEQELALLRASAQATDD